VLEPFKDASAALSSLASVEMLERSELKPNIAPALRSEMMKKTKQA